MSEASIVRFDPADARSSNVVRLLVPGLLLASVLYIVASTAVLPRIPNPSAAIDVFLAAAFPGLMVIMLLWAARPTAYPQRRRRALVAVTLLAAVTAAILPLLLRIA